VAGGDLAIVYPYCQVQTAKDRPLHRTEYEASTASVPRTTRLLRLHQDWQVATKARRLGQPNHQPRVFEFANRRGDELSFSKDEIIKE